MSKPKVIAVTLQEVNERIDNLWNVLSGQADRIDAAEDRAAREGSRSLRAIERIEAVEKAIQETRVDQGEMGLVTEQGERNIYFQINNLADCVAALEEEARATTENEKKTCERLDALEDAAQERADPIGKALADGHEDGYKRGRMEMAREIVEWVRRFNHTKLPGGPILDGERWANWVERKFCRPAEGGGDD